MILPHHFATKNCAKLPSEIENFIDLRTGFVSGRCNTPHTLGRYRPDYKAGRQRMVGGIYVKV